MEFAPDRIEHRNASTASDDGRSRSAPWRVSGRIMRSFFASPLKLTRLVAIFAITLSFSLPAEAATLYRYINDKGYQEIGYSIPNHLVPNGYDLIDESGRLIRRVAAQLSEEEYAIKLERERFLEACQKASESVHRRYETLEDIDAAERLFGEQLEESLRNYQANLDYGKSNLAHLQDQAAKFERAGKPITKNQLLSIENTELQIQNLTAQIDAGQRSRDEKALEFDEERRVFNLLECNVDQLARLD